MIKYIYILPNQRITIVKQVGRRIIIRRGEYNMNDWQLSLISLFDYKLSQERGVFVVLHIICHISRALPM
jgi:hypothetical protein